MRHAHFGIHINYSTGDNCGPSILSTSHSKIVNAKSRLTCAASQLIAPAGGAGGRGVLGRGGRVEYVVKEAERGNRRE